MKAEQKATAAVAELVKQRDDALDDNKRFQKNISMLQEALSSANQQIIKLEGRVYGGGVSALNDIYKMAMETHFYSRSPLIKLVVEPKSSRGAIPAETFRFGNEPMALVNEYIEQLVTHHSQHVREELRKCAWQAAEFARSNRR